jgi:AraC family transcriptional regulator of arabinose operon
MYKTSRHKQIVRENSQWVEGGLGQRMVVLPRDVVAKMEKHPLLSGLLPTDIGLFPQAEGHFIKRAKGVSQAIFIYCIKGGGWCEMRGQRHEVRANDLLVVPPGEPHSYGANKDQAWTILWFHVSGNDVRLFLGEMGVSAELPVLYLGEDPVILALFQDALEVLEHGYAPFQLVYVSRVLAHLISLMIRRVRENWRNQPDIKQKILYCMKYMKEHLEKPLHLNTVAMMANLSPSYFNLFFRKETGYTCMDYFTQLRIHQACQWLDATDWPIKAIAARLGFHDPLYFSRVFSSVRGMSPKEYRRTHKG